MGTFSIKKGRDIRLKGEAKKEIAVISLPRQAAVKSTDFKGLKARLVVQVGDPVKVGSPVLSDKAIPEIQVASPVSGRVIAINRGPKRSLESVIIESDGRQEEEAFPRLSLDQIRSLSSAAAVDLLLKGCLWPFLRQRPFSKVPNPHEKPKSIFVHAMNTEPLAADVDFILKDAGKEFQAGLEVLRRLTGCTVHLCIKRGSAAAALTQAQGVQIHLFSGPHPAGNVSTHIHCVDPISKGDLVWYIDAQDVLRIGDSLLNGRYFAQRIIAVTGEGAAGCQRYAQTVIGAPVSALLSGSIPLQMRFISGSVLAGKDVGGDGFAGFYDSQITVVPQGGKREFLGWLSPGICKYTFSKTFLSAFLPQREFSLDTDEHGSHRAIVLNNVYDDFVPLDVLTYFLLKAIISGNIEEAEALGILECDEEDFALCTFACPSKTDVGGIIRRGLELIEKEG